ncbi:Os10g0556000, partial [Oryza sativa Japonica Group]
VLDERTVDGHGGPVGRDDLAGDELLAGLVGDAEREGRREAVVGVEPPDGAPRLAHRRPRLGVGLHEIHLHHVAVAVLVLNQHREVHRVRPLLHVERHLQPREVARHPA